MAKIRETIELLTRVLQNNGTSSVNAETFRLAKFNDHKAVVPMWKLMFELLYFCNFGVIDELAVKASVELNKKEMIVYVKRELHHRGYLSLDFSTLSDDMTQGSRELLLAFGWLLCQEGVIDKFMEKCSSVIKEDTAAMYEMELEEKFKLSKQWSEGVSSGHSPADQVRQLVMLNGKLRMGLRSLYALQRERNHLGHKIHNATQGISLMPERNHLSMMEVYLMKHPEKLKKIMELLEKDNERLQNLLKWKEKEDVFWRWMESVLDLKLKESGEQNEEVGVNAVAPEDFIKVQEASKQLDKALMKYERITDYLEEVWEKKKSALSQQELDDHISSIDAEIALYKARLGLSKPKIQWWTLQEPRLCYKNPLPKKLTNVQTVSSCPNHLQEALLHDNKGSDIQEKIASLEMLVYTLEKEMKKRQLEYHEELEAAAVNFNELMCIPPLMNSLEK